MGIRDAVSMAMSGALTGWRLGRGGAVTKGAPQAAQVLGGGTSLAAQLPGQNLIPNAWGDTFLPPGRPIAPLLTTYRDQARELEPRTMSYPAGINATLSPRLGYGLLSFADLRYYAENVPETAMCIRLLSEELKTFVPTILGPDGQAVNVRKDLPELYWMVSKPDLRNRWSVWLGRFLNNVLAYDAGALSKRRDGHGRTRALRVIDGSTIFALVDENGETPLPPAPAYTSVIWGIPRMNMNSDQLWYQPRALRADAPYGRSFIEDSMQAVKWLEQFWLYQIAEWTEGNMPEMLVPAPPHWPDEKIREWEASLNAGLAGNPGQRAMRVKFIPAGFGTPIEKKTVFQLEAYTTALERVAFSAGIPPAELGKMPGKGLGGKGMSDKQEATFFRMGIDPLKTYVEQPFNEVLDELGYEGYTWLLKLPTDTVDPDSEQAALVQDWQLGGIRRNEYRTKRGYTADNTPDGNAYFPFPSKGAGDAPGAAGAAPGSDGADASGNPPVPNASGGPGAAPDPARPRVVTRVPVKGHAGAPGGNLPVPVASSSVPTNGHGTSGTVKVIRAGPARVIDGTPASSPVKVKPREPVSVNSDNNIFTVSKLAKADKVHDGSMVAVMLPADVAAALVALRDGLGLPAEAETEPAESMHVTLAYFPEPPLGATVLNIFAAMQVAALDFGYPSLEGKVQGFGIFENETGAVLWAGLDALGLADLRTTLCDQLTQRGVAYGTDHDFTPHVTLAYLPLGYKPELPSGSIDLPPVSIDGLTYAYGDEYVTLTLGKGDTRLGKADHPAPQYPRPEYRGLGAGRGLVRPISAAITALPPLAKHCGVCEEDETYFGAPVARGAEVPFPNPGANESEIVAMVPDGAEPRAALFKPEAGESAGLQARIGGEQDVREEAGYLLSRSLGFDLVPVAYVSELDGQRGAVIHYTFGAGPALDPSAYDPEWIERAAVLDYIEGQSDRRSANWLTHPDDPRRMILIDNGLAFPDGPVIGDDPFVEAQGDKPFSGPVLDALTICVGDEALWSDLKETLGKGPATAARIRTRALLTAGRIPRISDDTQGDSSGSQTS